MDTVVGTRACSFKLHSSFLRRKGIPSYRLLSRSFSNWLTFIPGVLVGPIGTIAFSLMYYNLRVRKEAFDLQHLMVALGPGSGPVAAAPGAPSTA